jgi:hypothetical protein
MFHMRDPELCNQIYSEVIQPYLADTEKARILQPDGTYTRKYVEHAGRKPFPFSVQDFLIGFAEGRESVTDVPSPVSSVHIPVVKQNNHVSGPASHSKSHANSHAKPRPKPVTKAATKKKPAETVSPAEAAS